jgi:hypothetical protein
LTRFFDFDIAHFYENEKAPPQSRLNREGALGCVRHGGRGERIHLRQFSRSHHPLQRKNRRILWKL